MINLLPPAAKRKLASEYRFRFLSVLFVTITAACLMSIVLSIPTWIFLERQSDIVIGREELATEIELERKQVEEDLAETQSLVDFLAKPLSTRDYSKLISDLDSLSGEAVSISQISVDAKGKLILTGVAATRTALSEFRDRLTADERFTSVDLPLSSLVRDTETPFSITIKLK